MVAFKKFTFFYINEFPIVAWIFCADYINIRGILSIKPLYDKYSIVSTLFNSDVLNFFLLIFNCFIITYLLILFVRTIWLIFFNNEHFKCWVILMTRKVLKLKENELNIKFSAFFIKHKLLRVMIFKFFSASILEQNKL